MNLNSSSFLHTFLIEFQALLAIGPSVEETAGFNSPFVWFPITSQQSLCDVCFDTSSTVYSCSSFSSAIVDYLNRSNDGQQRHYGTLDGCRRGSMRVECLPTVGICTLSVVCVRRHHEKIVCILDWAPMKNCRHTPSLRGYPSIGY